MVAALDPEEIRVFQEKMARVLLWFICDSKVFWSFICAVFLSEIEI
jgi:hypothetical protein